MVAMAVYKVMLDEFEGPLDLLLHLIHQAEVDIYDIPVAKITEQYLQYVQTMQELKLDIASEYLIMAATLLEIKSKQLLPKHEETDEMYDEDMMDDEGDPRQELMKRLVEYRKYKEAAAKFKEKELERSSLHTKAPADLKQYYNSDETSVSIAGVTLFDMIEALNKVLKRKETKKQVAKTIKMDEISIESRMDEIIVELDRFEGRCSFSDLFHSNDRSHIIVSFLAVLELIKMKQIICRQEENFSDIIVSKCVKVV